MSEDEQVIYNRRNLEYRAALYYRSIRLPKEMWLSLDDLTPQIMEFNHYISAHAYDEAALVLNEIDFDYLTLWGHAARVIDMHLKIYGKVKDLQLNGQHLANMGYAYLAISNYEEAIKYSREALLIQNREGYLSDEALTLGNLGRIHHQKGEYKKSISFYQEAIDKARSIGNKDLVSVFLANLAIAQYLDGDYSATVDNAREAVELAGTKRDKSRALSSLGLAFQGLGNYKDAEENLLSALAIAIELDDFRSQSFRYGHLGNLYFELGEYSTSLESHTRGYAAAESAKSKELIAARMYGIGKAHNALETYPEAETVLARALSLSLEIDFIKNHTDSCIALMQSYLFQNNVESAKEVSDFLLERNSETEFFKALIYLRRGETQVSHTFFGMALEFLDNEAAYRIGNFHAQYLRGLILIGLWLLGDKKLYTASRVKDELSKAYSQNKEKGVRNYYAKIVGEFVKASQSNEQILALLRMLQE